MTVKKSWNKIDSENAVCNVKSFTNRLRILLIRSENAGWTTAANNLLTVIAASIYLY
jgi:hypothetical protein